MGNYSKLIQHLQGLFDGVDDPDDAPRLAGSGAFRRRLSLAGLAEPPEGPELAGTALLLPGAGNASPARQTVRYADPAVLIPLLLQAIEK